MSAWILAAAAWATAQADPGERACTFVVREGWSLSVKGERDLFPISEEELTQGLQPRFYVPQQDPRAPFPPPTYRRPRSQPAPASSAGYAYRRSREEPLRLEGTLRVAADRSVRLVFRRIHYVDTTQSWRIEFDDGKVQASGLGAASTWRGSREEWIRRLEAVERAALEAYVRSTSPLAADAKPGFGFGMSAGEDPGRRLYSQLCLEDQLSLLLLARLDGERLEGSLWPAAVAKYPPRAIRAARLRVERLVRQAAGDLAPPKAREAKSRAVKEQPIEEPVLALPAPVIEPAGDWLADRLKPIEEARRRLSQIALDSQRTLGIEEGEWRRLVRQEAERLKEVLQVRPLPRTPDFLQTLLTPRLVESGKGLYDYREKGAGTAVSEVDCSGVLADLDVAFFVSGPNVWKAVRVRLDPWHTADLRGQP
ncbi:MAG TPA: hypothetical protein VEJ18_07240 [Planctomycetota bacterium]|nr:hypothetical protein [Planctomycetota bacterium]